MLRGKYGRKGWGVMSARGRETPREQGGGLGGGGGEG